MITSENVKRAENLVALLNEKGLRVTFAESCTGGLLGATLTSVSGASGVFDGSVVSYANEVNNKSSALRRACSQASERSLRSVQGRWHLALAECFPLTARRQ